MSWRFLRSCVRYFNRLIYKYWSLEMDERAEGTILENPLALALNSKLHMNSRVLKKSPGMQVILDPYLQRSG